MNPNLIHLYMYKILDLKREIDIKIKRVFKQIEAFSISKSEILSTYIMLCIDTENPFPPFATQRSKTNPMN